MESSINISYVFTYLYFSLLSLSSRSLVKEPNRVLFLILTYFFLQTSSFKGGAVIKFTQKN